MPAFEIPTPRSYNPEMILDSLYDIIYADPPWRNLDWSDHMLVTVE